MSRINAHFKEYKKAFLLAVEQDDYKVLQILSQVGKYLGVVYVRPSNNSRYYSTMKRLIIILLLTIYSAGIFSSLPPNKQTTFKLRLVALVADAIFVCCFLLDAQIKSRKSWSILLDNLTKMEQVMEQLQLSPARRKWGLISRIFLFWVAFLVTTSYQLHCYNLHAPYAFFITNMYMTALLTYTSCVTSFLQSRFQFVESRIRLMADDDLDCECIGQLTKFMKTASRIVERLNCVLGIPIFTFINSTVVGLLNHVCYMLYNAFEDEWHKKASLASGIIVYLAVMVIIIMSCDAVEQCGKNVVQACYQVHHKTKNMRKKKQILLLATYAEEWRPIFSAAGFYDVNQECLNSIFTASINYLVIIVQFNLMITAPNNN